LSIYFILFTLKKIGQQRILIKMKNDKVFLKTFKLNLSYYSYPL